MILVNIAGHLLNRPITLIGKGDKTPIFGKGSPAVIVLSSHVRSKDIEIADFFDASNGIALLVQGGTGRACENVKINGQTKEMSQEQIVDFGYFYPEQMTSTYFEIEVSGPSRIKCLGRGVKMA